MVWRHKNRAERKKRAKLEKFRKASIPIITRIQPSNSFLLKSVVNFRRRLIGARNQDRASFDVPVVDIIFNDPTNSSSNKTFLDFEFPSSSYSSILDNFQNSEPSAASHSLIPPKNNRSYDEIFQSLEYLIEFIRSSSPSF